MKFVNLLFTTSGKRLKKNNEIKPKIWCNSFRKSEQITENQPTTFIIVRSETIFLTNKRTTFLIVLIILLFSTLSLSFLHRKLKYCTEYVTEVTSKKRFYTVTH